MKSGQGSRPDVASAVISAQMMSPEALKSLVLQIVTGDQDYGRLLTLLEPAIHNPQGLDTSTALTLALLLDEVEQRADLNDQLHALTRDPGAPALAIAQTGAVLAQNQAAIDVFGPAQGKPITRLGIRRTEFEAFGNRLVQHEGASLLRAFPGAQHDPPLMFSGIRQVEHQVYLLRAIDCQWTPSIDTALRDIFDLTDAERDILARLAQGLSSDQISRQRQSRVTTVRQQIKSLLSKLGASSQVQAAALASALASRADPVAAPGTLPDPSSQHPLLMGERVRDNRRVGWRRFGLDGGRPVLLMHGAYFGAGDHEPDRAWAVRAGLDVLCVERPGYGRTQPPNRGADILDTQVRDSLAVLDELGWDSVWLNSHDFGFVPALALSRYRPERVKGVLAVSPPPVFDRDSDFSQIPRNQRSFIWAARNAFWMIRLLLRLGHVKARQLGPEHWMDMVFEEADEDRAVFHRPGLQSVSVGAFHFNLNQNSKGHELDLLTSVATDWSDLLREVDRPLVALTGQRNATFPVTDVRRLKALNPAMSMQEIEDAGLTLCLSHTDFCFESLFALIHDPGT